MSGEDAPFKFAVTGFLGHWLLRAFRATWIVKGRAKDYMFERRAARAGKPGTIYVQWHSRTLLAVATHRGCGVNILVSQHGDGEHITRVMLRHGFGAIRGSTTRGGARALLEVVRALRDGKDVGITPDGPKGPRFRVQPGCVVAAMKTGAPIVPLAFECSRVKRLRSWDRFIVPLPFAKVAVVQGEPVEVPAGLDEAGVALWCGNVQRALLDASRRAAEVIGVEAETPEIDPLTGVATPAVAPG